jgi:hypothetical protein
MDVFRAEVDFEQVLYRLAGAARSKSIHRSGMLRVRDELVLPGGDSATDLLSLASLAVQ